MTEVSPGALISCMCIPPGSRAAVSSINSNVGGLRAYGEEVTAVSAR